MASQSDMKKANDRASMASDVKASSASDARVGPDASLELGIEASLGSSGVEGASAAENRSEGATPELVKPKINKKGARPKSKPEDEANRRSKPSGRAKRKAESDLADSPNSTQMASAGGVIANDYDFAEAASEKGTSAASRYRPVGQVGDRIAIFIDGSNLFYAASHLNIEVDYRRLLSTLVGDRRLLRAYFYTGVDPQNEKQRGFLLWLNRHGHRVVSKELTHMPDGSRKANMHVEMAVDMMRISEHCPTITLLGGDGNLAYALEVLSQRGLSIEVVSLQSMTSDSLIDLADSYVDLADLRDEIKR